MINEPQKQRIITHPIEDNDSLNQELIGISKVTFVGCQFSINISLDVNLELTEIIFEKCSSDIDEFHLLYYPANETHIFSVEFDDCKFNTTIFKSLKIHRLTIFHSYFKSFETEDCTYNEVWLGNNLGNYEIENNFSNKNKCSLDTRIEESKILEHSTFESTYSLIDFNHIEISNDIFSYQINDYYHTMNVTVKNLNQKSALLNVTHSYFNCFNISSATIENIVIKNCDVNRIYLEKTKSSQIQFDNIRNSSNLSLFSVIELFANGKWLLFSTVCKYS